MKKTRNLFLMIALVSTAAALSAQGPYRVVSSFYEPIPEWIAGFAVTTAIGR